MMNGANKKTIYLDNAASTPVTDEALNAFIEASRSFGNPSSLHDYGYKARGYIIQSQQMIARQLKCSESELHFTSGATMSNNLLFKVLCEHINIVRW